MPCHLFYTAQTIISQQNGKILRYDSSRLSPKSVLTTFLLCSKLILKCLSNSSCRPWSCSHVAFRSAQSNSPRLVTDPGLFHDNTKCGFFSLVRTPTLQKQLQKVAISAFTEHIRLFNANLAFQKGLLQRERERKKNNKFRVFYWGSGIHFYNGLSADL